MTARPTRAEVRNPVLSLPAAERLRTLDPDSRSALRAVLIDLQMDARQRAETSWRRHKAPMAAYWKAVSVYAGHLARALSGPAHRRPSRGQCPADPRVALTRGGSGPIREKREGEGDLPASR
ncbi:hypothetical protein GCM10011349_32370 [Novosphingobium indicum]|uniref:Uncharacterized protein n=1 Tax=Novosphingobium indicum TaxID=462949 RepID=A0ABQ2JTZ6_9SPHN|nr:hypothetical protein GCM10011349_32370 [Novosphingobium indicum]